MRFTPAALSPLSQWFQRCFFYNFFRASFAGLAVLFALALPLFGQVYNVPNNYPTVADPIGIPPMSSTDGTNEDVLLSSGALNTFIPVVSLPQVNGTPLTLGYRHSSETWGLRERIAPSSITNQIPPADTSNTFEFFQQLVPSLMINLPTLSASINYIGMNTNPQPGPTFPCIDKNGIAHPQYLPYGGSAVMGVTNFVFTDWAGNAHSFPTNYGNGIAEYNQNTAAIPGIIDGSCDLGGPTFNVPTLIGDSSDGSVMRLDLRNKNDITVTDKHGSVYHFTGYVSPFYFTGNPPTTPTNYTGWFPPGNPGPVGGGFEFPDAYYDVASSIVDPHGSTISIKMTANDPHPKGTDVGPFVIANSQYTLTDTVGRQVLIAPSGVTYQDSQNNSRTVSVTNGTGSGQTSYPGPHITGSSCTLVNSRGTLPSPGLTDYEPTGPIPVPETTITFPAVNGVNRTYNLQFDGLGRLTNIQYPAGGSTSYTYKGYSALRQTFVVKCQYTMDQLLAKSECTNSSNSCSSPATTQYKPTVTPTLNANSAMQATDPAGNITNVQFTNFFNTFPAQAYPLETNRTYSNASGTVLKTIATSYYTGGACLFANAPPNYPTLSLPEAATTTLNDSSSSPFSTIQYTYGDNNLSTKYGSCWTLSDGNVTQTSETDNYTGQTRTTQMIYQDEANPTGSYTIDGGHILDRFASKTVLALNSGVQSSTNYGYNTVGDVTSKTDTGTNTSAASSSYVVDPYGNPTQLTDPLSKVTKVGYGSPGITGCPSTASIGLPTSITDALGHVSYMAYYPNGLLACKKDPNGLVTSYSYDALNRLASQTNPDGGTVTTSYVDTAPLSVTTQQSLTTAASIVHKTIYDGFNRPIQSQLVSDPDGATFTDTVYDPAGRVQSVSNPYRSTSDSTYGITKYVYDPLSRPCVVIPPDGTPTSTCPTASSLPANDVSTIYSGNNTTVYDQAGNSRTSTTNAFGQLTQVVEPLVTTTVPGADSKGQICFQGTAGQCQPGSGSPCGTISGTIGTFTFSMNYNRGAGGSNMLDSLTGFLAGAIDVSASPVIDQPGGPNNSCALLTSKLTGSNQDYTVTASDSEHNFTITTQNMTGGITTVTGQFNPTTNYQYDALGNLLSVRQMVGASSNAVNRSFTYDALSRLTSATNPESGMINYAYDLGGNLTSKTSPAPNQTGSATQTISYCYDALNRLTAKGYGAQTCTNGSLPTPAATYWYDGKAPTCSTGLSSYGLAIGRRSAMCDAGGAEGWSFADIASTGWQITDKRTTNGVAKTNISQANLAGLVATLTYPSATALTYTESAAGRPTAVTTYAKAAHYAPQGALAALTSGSALNSAYIFNSRLQPCWMAFNNGAATIPWNTEPCSGTATAASLIDLKYNFVDGNGHNNGNVIGVANDRDATRSQTFAYDTFNRLIQAQTTSTYATSPAHCWGELFNPDPWGNLLSIQANAPTYNGCTQEAGFNYTVNQGTNRISAFCYDAAGNLLDQNACPGSNHAYVYDTENRLASTAGVTYTYDGDGKRVMKTGGPIYWYGPSGEVLDETDTTGSVTNSSFHEYVYFGGQRIARRDGSGNVLYYFADHLGTSRVTTNAAGVIQDDSDFFPFGGEKPMVSTSGNHYKFTGKERDTESGLDYFGNRHYGSSLGRFMQPDEPFNDQNTHDPQSWNLYGYVRNNPLRYTDPTGNACVQGSDGNWHNDNSGGESCEDVNKNNQNAQPSATVTATALPTELEYQAAYAQGMGMQNAMFLARFDAWAKRANPIINAYMFVLPFAKFSVEEQAIADALEAEGNEVTALEVVQGQKNPDALVNGVKTEFKTVTVAGPNTLKNQIQDGLKQAPNVVVDARGTSITKAQAMQQIQRVEGNMGSVQGRVTILTNEGAVKH